MPQVVTYPSALSEHQASKTMRCGGSETRWAPQELLVHDCHFQEVLCQRPCFEIVVVCLANSAQEAHRSWPAEFKLKHGKHESLCLEDLVNRVSTIDHVDDLLHGRTIDLLILGSNEDSCCPDQLQFAKRNNLAGQKTVDVVDGEEQSFRQKVEPMMNLDEPIHEDSPH